MSCFSVHLLCVSSERPAGDASPLLHSHLKKTSLHLKEQQKAKGFSKPVLFLGLMTTTCALDSDLPLKGLGFPAPEPGNSSLKVWDIVPALPCLFISAS